MIVAMNVRASSQRGWPITFRAGSSGGVIIDACPFFNGSLNTIVRSNVPASRSVAPFGGSV
jgi:hypothetical protein